MTEVKIGMSDLNKHIKNVCNEKYMFNPDPSNFFRKLLFLIFNREISLPKAIPLIKVLTTLKYWFMENKYPLSLFGGGETKDFSIRLDVHTFDEMYDKFIIHMEENECLKVYLTEYIEASDVISEDENVRKHECRLFLEYSIYNWKDAWELAKPKDPIRGHAFMTVGLVGAGKTTNFQSVQSSYREQIVYIDQDEFNGNKKAMLYSLNHILRRGGNVFIGRNNTNSSQSYDVMNLLKKYRYSYSYITYKDIVSPLGVSTCIASAIQRYMDKKTTDSSDKPPDIKTTVKVNQSFAFGNYRGHPNWNPDIKSRDQKGIVFFNQNSELEDLANSVMDILKSINTIKEPSMVQGKIEEIELRDDSKLNDKLSYRRFSQKTS